ncbi:MAG: ASKHA domain-containing protein [Clostridia bacterium]|jgi:uncharacterized 2Fe-2S/4Fe-4S cluster protein (DUF4445 family)|nr:ASKHA domain-containing protein [Clostridia bacterium]
MSNIKIIFNNNEERSLNISNGTNLLIGLIENGILIPAACGGKGLCGKCKVRLIEGNVTTDILDGYFKSCKHIVNGDMTIGIDILEGKGLSIANNIDYEIIPQLNFGLAVDIGTTTIVMYLVDLSDGKIVEVISELNNQAMYGADVVNRINAAGQGQLLNLQKIIDNQINNAIKYLSQKYKIIISKVVIAGNTTMLHLAIGVDPTSLGVFPFSPIFLEKKMLSSKIGIDCEEIILLPSASAYIGSDVVAGIISSGMLNCKAINLFIDIGTNGEIVLNNKGKLSACATAAGPAFEGANIEKGMGGVSHAIDHISYNKGKLLYTTVDLNPLGICGSGLLDIIAILINNEIIDETGALNKSDKNNPLIKLIRDNKLYITDEVYISQKDIREFQLAKSAIHSGIETLIDEAKLSINSIDKVFLAGGFGYYMDNDSAIKSGLLPNELKDKIINVGNSSGLGAIMCTNNNKYIGQCEDIAKKIDIIELSNSKKFMELFIENMSFKKG